MYYFKEEDLYLPHIQPYWEATSFHREVSCLVEAAVGK